VKGLNTPSALEVLRTELPAPARVFVVHRIDRFTSGAILFAVVVATGCSSSSPDPVASYDAGTADVTSSDSAASDASTDASSAADTAPIDKAATCAASFGSDLIAPYGRLDGTVLAVVPPAHPTCAMPNGTHLVLQVTMKGAAYRMVVNVESEFLGVDPKVRFLAVDKPLPAPAWSEGWHAGVTLDYATTLDVHVAAFSPLAKDDLVKAVTDAIPLGAKVSVYSTTSGGASSHKVHRNGASDDGAIVLGPDTAAPRFLLFHFDQQTF
jgi:hypothetical protein